MRFVNLLERCFYMKLIQKKIDPEKLRLFKKLKVDKWSGGRPSGYDPEAFSDEKQTRIVPKDSDPNFVKGREPTAPKVAVEIDDEQRTVSHEENA